MWKLLVNSVSPFLSPNLYFHIIFSIWKSTDFFFILDRLKIDKNNLQSIRKICKIKCHIVFYTISFLFCWLMLFLRFGFYIFNLCYSRECVNSKWFNKSSNERANYLFFLQTFTYRDKSMNKWFSKQIFTKRE